MSHKFTNNQNVVSMFIVLFVQKYIIYIHLSPNDGYYIHRQHTKYLEQIHKVKYSTTWIYIDNNRIVMSGDKASPS